MMSDGPSETRSVRARIEGHVQGVCFRAWTRALASQLGLSGWVRNRHDGSVEAVFSGAPDAVAKMLENCRKGPDEARVDDVSVLDEDASVPQGFEINSSA
jgi:acylphosphatase